MDGELLASVSSVEDARKLYEQLCVQEDSIERQLDDCLKQDEKLSQELKFLLKSLPNGQLLQSDATQLHSQLSFAAQLAETVSHKVKKLDRAKNRVSHCLNRIKDILDLKLCTEGIQKSLLDEDYEQAAALIHRFLSMDESVLRKSASEDVESSLTDGSSMDEAFAKLHQAELQLKKLVSERLDEAMANEDAASIERFLKIYPLLNQHEAGINKFANFLCMKLNERRQEPTTGVPFAQKLTQFYEKVAKLVDANQAIIETYYGPGHLFKVVKVLQRECDKQAKRILIDYKNKKGLDRHVTAVRRAMESMDEGDNTNRIDPREIDSILTEMTTISMRSELYLRFIGKRCKNDLETAYSAQSDPAQEEKKKRALESVNNLIRTCELSLCLQEMSGMYVLMEEYFLRESANKAIELDTVDSSNLTSSMLDDVFFIIKKCIKRALSSGNIDVVCALVNHSVSLLESTFYETLNERIRLGYPTASITSLDISQAYNVIQAGRYLQSASDIEKAKTEFLTAINNLDLASEYVKTLKEDLLKDTKTLVGSNMHTIQAQTIKLDSCLGDFVAIASKFQTLAASGLGHLNKTIFKPRIKTWIEGFLAVDHTITEDDLILYEANDGMRAFTQTFIMNLNSLFETFKELLTSNNFDTLINLVSSEFATRCEAALYKCRYNRLGGMQFDRELRAIINFITSCTSWGVRDKFSRLKQMAVILSIESTMELNEYLNSDNSGPSSTTLGSSPPSSLTSSSANFWRLSPAEIRQILKLRNDWTS